MTYERGLFFVASAFNFAVALALVVPGSPAWPLFGMAPPESMFFVHMSAAFAALFGAAYVWIGVDIAGKFPLIALAIVGKLVMFTLTLIHWLAGSVPLALVGAGAGDLVFAILFWRVAMRLP